jgi:hypothetical protein
VLVDATDGVGASAVAECDATALEVAEELVPLGVGGGAVLLAGARLPAAGDVSAVAVDGLLGIDGLVAHGGVDVGVAGEDLGDVGRMPLMIASVVKILRKSWGRKSRGLPSVPVMPEERARRG